MSNGWRLRELAKKCEELASVAPNDQVRARQLELAEGYRRMAAREDWLEQHSYPLSREREKATA